MAVFPGWHAPCSARARPRSPQREVPMPRWILMTLAAAAALTLYQIIRGGVSWLARQIEKSIKQ